MARPTILDNIEPPDIGLPAKFSTFRQVQREMVDFAIYGPNEDGVAQRFAALGAPPGSGKSLGSEAIAKVAGARVVTLTATRSLQDQRRDDFELADVRGRSNYPCEGIVIKDKVSGEDKHSDCETGFDYNCKLEGSVDCPYFQAVENASFSSSVSTNYQWWMNARAMNGQALEKMGPIDILILDEAHLAPEELARFLSVQVGLKDIYTYCGRVKEQLPWIRHKQENGKVDADWVQLLQDTAFAMQAERTRRIEAIREAAREECSYVLDGYQQFDNEKYKELVKQGVRRDREIKRLDKVVRDIGRLTFHGADGNWIWQLAQRGGGVAGGGGALEFDVVWPARYAERYLFSGVKKVVMMSATLRPKLFSLLGLKRSEVDFKEWPRQFSAVLGPVYHLPTLKVTWKSSEQELRKMVETVDRLIEARPGRRTLIHTQSYKRAEWLQAHSRYGRFMILNSSGAGYRGGGGLTAQQAADKYRETMPTAEHPAILVGPSFSTGWDFIGDECELNIIIKIPWPDLSSPIMKARAEDEGYAAYVTMQDLVQACGRGQRHEQDRCETVILDDGIKNFQ